jgi:hypothetical protein
MLHLTGMSPQVITQGHHGDPERRAGTPSLDAARCPDLLSTSGADQPDLREG